MRSLQRDGRMFQSLALRSREQANVWRPRSARAPANERETAKQRENAMLTTEIIKGINERHLNYYFIASQNEIMLIKERTNVPALARRTRLPGRC